MFRNMFSPSSSGSRSPEELQPRPMGLINWIGLWNLILKECRRFMNVWLQTVAAPVITGLLFVAIFSLAVSRANLLVDGLPFFIFIVPGLIMMGVVQSAFSNSSSSLLVSKVAKNIVDVLYPPLGPWELVMGYCAGALLRGLLVGLLTWLFLMMFIPLVPVHWDFAFYFIFSGGLMMALAGILAGIWAEKFDHLATVTNFVVMPLSFLSGTFYPIDRLPVFFQKLTLFNPFYYVIDGFRFALTGREESSLLVGVLFLLGVNLTLFYACQRLLSSGYRLKS